MADTATYAGAMKIKYVNATPAKKRSANKRAAARRVKKKRHVGAS